MTWAFTFSSLLVFLEKIEKIQYTSMKAGYTVQIV